MTRQRPTQRRFLCLEPLEDRCLLSAGALDPTFGSGGVVTTKVGLAGAWERPAALAVYPTGDIDAGKIVAAGNAAPRLRGGLPDQDFALVRYNPDGSLDTSFGSGGKITTDVGSGGDNAFAVQIQADGKILVAGGNTADFVLVRYNRDGSLDTTFGGKAKGKVLTDINRSTDAAKALAIQPDGRIVVAGLTISQKGAAGIALVRYNADGSLDRSFDGDGKVTRFFTSPVSSDRANVKMVLTPDGKIIVTALLDNQTGPDSVVVLRFNADGSPDASFGSGGMVTLADAHTVPAVAVQPDGRIVVTSGSVGGWGNQDIRVARLQADGTPDPAFGSGGTVVTAVAYQNVAPYSVGVQSDGKIVVAGTEGDSSDDNHFFVARYNADGSPDDGSAVDSTPWDSFGVNGIGEALGVTINTDGVGLAVQSDGGLVVTGTRTNIGTGGTTSDYNFALARFLSDSALAAASTAPSHHATTITESDAQPLLDEALQRWAAEGADVSSLAGLTLHVAGLGGQTLGLATQDGIWLDDDAAGWGWFVDPTPHDDSEFSTPGNQGEKNRMDLLSVLMHEVGHLLDYDHQAQGVMTPTLQDGQRLTFEDA